MKSLNDNYPNLTIVSHRFSIDEAGLDSLKCMGVPLPEQLQQAVCKRQAEYLAGRYCSAQALRQLGIYSSKVAMQEDGSPAWPQGVVGSITHSSGRAFAVAARSEYYGALGVDLERVIAESTAVELTSMVMIDAEKNLGLQSNLAFNEFFTLTFSAKESLYKLLYGQVKRFFDFSAAEITAIDLDSQQFTLVLKEKLTPGLPVGARFSGHFRWFDNQLLTLMALPPSA